MTNVRVTARNRGSNRCRDRVLYEGASITVLAHSGAGPTWNEHFSFSFYGEQAVRVTLSASEAKRLADYIHDHTALAAERSQAATSSAEQPGAAERGGK